MVNKRGWLRIVEAFIAILLIVTFLIITYVKTNESNNRVEEVYKLEKGILDEIALDEGLRNNILLNEEQPIRDFVERRAGNVGFNVSIRICNPDDVCNLPFYQKEVFSRDRIICGNLTSYEPKKIKIFMWIE